MRAAFLLVLATAALYGCPDHGEPTDAGPDTSCALPYLGDPSKDIELELRALGADGTDAPIQDGGDVALIFPPQGGRVIFAGVRATNLDPCAVQLSGAVRDLATQQVRVDARTVNLIPDATGWGTSGAASQSVQAAVSNYANVPLCPNEWSQTNVFDNTYGLEVTVTDKAKRKATKIIKVTPRCAEPTNAAECTCLCKAGYVLGENCMADGGSDQ